MSPRFSRFLLALALAATGCTSLPERNAQYVERWPSFLLDSAKRDVVLVERVSSNYGKVVTAHSSVDGGTLCVSGLVNRFGAEVPRGSHLDVMLLNAKGAVLASTTSDYFPRELPRVAARGFRHSRYSAVLPLPRHPGSTVRVVFHDAPLTECVVETKTKK